MLHHRVIPSKGYPLKEEEVNTQRDPFVLKASLKNPGAAHVEKEPWKYCGEVELAKDSELSRVSDLEKADLSHRYGEHGLRC